MSGFFKFVVSVFRKVVSVFFKNAKWPKKVEAAQAETREAAAATPWTPPLAPFDFSVLKPQTEFSVWLANRVLLVYFWFARLCCPFPPLLIFWKVVCVSRAPDVKSVLEDSATYGVVYGPEMKELAGGTKCNFMLGLDGPDHEEERQLATRVWLQGDDEERIVAQTRRVAEALIAASGGTINVMSDLITRVAAETCITYFSNT